MVYYKLRYQSANMAASVSLSEPCLKSKQISGLSKSRRVSNSLNHQKLPGCERARSGVVDVVIFIAVLGALGVLVYPYVQFSYLVTVEIAATVMPSVKEEVYEHPAIYGSLAFSVFCLTIVAWMIVFLTGRKCSRPNCRGLNKAAEFDIQLETEDCLKDSSSVSKDSVKMGLFELPCDHHRELEAELRNMAPPNGRAVLIFRVRCGCSVGRMEVPGPRKAAKKIKK